ncbi:MAG TPA: rhodanese-like domain-containing protein [Gemmataceae bacterium]
MSEKTISPKALYELRQAGIPVDLVDVRTPAEFREVHAEGARLVPLDRLDPKALLAERPGANGEPIYVICRSGTRAKKACEKFAAAGVENVVLVEGGTQAWEQAGLPVKRGKRTISLERQVRIAAGLLVLLGVGLGYFVHPAFLAVSAFVGAGLVFAGVTDTCGMAMLLARMPWNQAGGPAGEAPAPKKEDARPAGADQRGSCCGG